MSIRVNPWFLLANDAAVYENRENDLLDIRLLLQENKNAVTERKLRELCETYAAPGAYELIRPVA